MDLYHRAKPVVPIHFFLELLPLKPETEKIVRSADNTSRCAIGPKSSFTTHQTTERGRGRGPMNTPPLDHEDEESTRAKLRLAVDQPQRRPSRSFTTLGRSKDCCDVVIDEQEVSYQHCHLEYDPSAKVVLLRDTSTNGTFFKDISGTEGEPSWRPYRCRALLALQEMKLLTACIKIGSAEFALRKALDAGTVAHRALLASFDAYSRHRLNDLALTELKMDAGNYRPTAVSTPRGEILLAPADPDLQRIATLGSGSFGTVYRVLDMHTGRSYAQKAIRRLKDDGWTELVEREILCMSKVSHEHIVEFVGFQQHLPQASEVCFLMALYSGDLDGIIPKPSIGPLLCKQLLQAVKFLHGKNIIHRDIKPANILIQSADPLHLRLTDFGLSKIIEDTTNTLAGTKHYMAPEMTAGHKYTKKVDIYAVGMTLYKTLGGFMSGTSSITTFRREVRKQLQERFMETDAYDILSKMLCKDPAQRVEAGGCLSDPYIVGRQSQSTSVGLFKAALAMTTSDEQQLKIALHHQRKAKSPFLSRPALPGAVRGVTRGGPGADGRVVKIKGQKRAFLKQ